MDIFPMHACMHQIKGYHILNEFKNHLILDPKPLKHNLKETIKAYYGLSSQVLQSLH